MYIDHIDQVVHELLTEPAVCNIQLPRIPKRVFFISSRRLPKRISPLQKEDDYELFKQKYKAYFDVDNISLSDTSEVEVEMKIEELKNKDNDLVPKKRKKSKKKGK